MVAVELMQDQLVSWVTKDEHPRDIHGKTFQT